MRLPSRRDAEIARAPAAEPGFRPEVEDSRVIARMRTAFELSDLAVKMQRQNLRRRHPAADDEEISRRLREWLGRRPGAEHGDASGPDFRVSTRFAHLQGRAETGFSE